MKQGSWEYGDTSYFDVKIGINEISLFQINCNICGWSCDNYGWSNCDNCRWSNCDNCGGVATAMINCDNCEKVACMLVIVL